MLPSAHHGFGDLDPQNDPFWTPPGDPNPMGAEMAWAAPDGDTPNAYALAMAPWAIWGYSVCYPGCRPSSRPPKGPILGPKMGPKLVDFGVSVDLDVAILTFRV